MSIDARLARLELNARKRRERKARYARQKAELLRTLGGQCALCKSTTDLTFDHHPYPISWDASYLNSASRLKRYIEEAKDGLLRVLCFTCNRSQGRQAPAQEEPAEAPAVPDGEPF